MSFLEVVPVVDHSVRGLCTAPYPGHKDGCPCFTKKPTCPPHAPLIGNVIDLSRRVWAVWTTFDMDGHRRMMKEKHPQWSERQLVNCLYWQPAARKNLRIEISNFFLYFSRMSELQSIGLAPMKAIDCPEAMGVNVTETMRSIGVELEWPPQKVAYQVAVVGFRGGA